MSKSVSLQETQNHSVSTSIHHSCQLQRVSSAPVGMVPFSHELHPIFDCEWSFGSSHLANKPRAASVSLLDYGSATHLPIPRQRSLADIGVLPAAPHQR